MLPVVKDILSSLNQYTRRLRVETGSTAYNEGRAFRAVHEFALGAGEVRVIKFAIAGNIDLRLSRQNVDVGGLDYRVYAGGVEGGTFDQIIPTRRGNNKSGVPIVAPMVTISYGGTLDVTGVDPADIVRLLTANASGQRFTVGGDDGIQRGFPATTAYVVLSTLAGAAAPAGVLHYEWEQE